MIKHMFLAAGAAMLVSTTMAAASNELVLLSKDDFLNQADIAIEGNENRLVISQEHTGGGSANIIAATINGDLNGGPLGASFSAVAAQPGLQPGALVQSGFNNAMTISVDGTANLFAFSQVGSGNVLRASIAGYQNEAAVAQTGTNNFASLAQNGVGNIVSIVQHSW